MTEKAEEIPLSVSAVTVAVATYTAKDVSVHNTPTDLWLIVDKEIFNVSEFQDEHPGGKKSASDTPHPAASVVGIVSRKC
jgi:cytochrome b involved in lipid metabolism